MSSMKMTLLEIVQEILDELDADSVSSIDETLEADQVSRIVKGTYFDIIATRDWPELKELFKLVAISDSRYPNYLRLPDNVAKLDTFKYNVSEDASVVTYRDICKLTPEDFLDHISGRSGADTDVDQITEITSGTTLHILNNKFPTYYTSFDDYYVVCDAYKQTIDNTLQASKTQCWGKVIPTFTLSNTFVPDIDETAFRYLVNEAKSRAFSILHKTINQKVEQTARRQKVRIQNDKYRTENWNERPNYGRN